MVDGDPQPLPLEEQLKQDPRFEYIAELKPEIVYTLAGLVKTQQSDPDDLHSSLWINWFSAKDTLLSRSRTDLEVAERGFEGHEALAIKELGEAQEAVDVSRVLPRDSIREERELLSHIIMDEPEELDAWAVFIRDLPKWLVEQAQSTSQAI